VCWVKPDVLDIVYAFESLQGLLNCEPTPTLFEPSMRSHTRRLTHSKFRRSRIAKSPSPAATAMACWATRRISLAHRASSVVQLARQMCFLDSSLTACGTKFYSYACNGAQAMPCAKKPTVVRPAITQPAHPKRCLNRTEGVPTAWAWLRALQRARYPLCPLVNRTCAAAGTVQLHAVGCASAAHQRVGIF